jgi:glucokinase-like ROK family protein
MSETTFLGSNLNLVKSHNQQAILLHLLYDKQLSRIQLARKTSLSTTTITNLVAELVEQGIVAEVGTQNHEGQRKVGRPRTALRLVPDARFTIGVHIGIGLVRVAVANLCAEIICNNIEYFSLDIPPTSVLDQIVFLIEQTISQSGVERSRIIGVGVGASGLVNYQTGVNVLAPNLGWHSVPIKQHLENALNLPTTVDNNVRAMAVGEAFFGLGRDVDSIAFVYGRVGVGAGFVFDGKVFRGSSTGAGEIGHMIMLPKGGETCRCGNRGCLETLVSEPVIVKQALLLAKKKPDSLLASYLTNNQNGSRPIERIFEAARQGDTATCEMIQERAAYLGLALANLVNMLNPDLIILGGVFAQGQDLILPTALKTLQETAFGHMGEKVRLQTTGFGWNAGVIGAAALALINFFYYQAGQA